MCTHKLLPVPRSSTDSNTNIKYFRNWKWQFIVQGIESWLLPHQQISDLSQDTTVPKGTCENKGVLGDAELPQARRKWKKRKKEVTRVPSADYLKTAEYFWSMFQETGKTTGWGWDGNKRGIEIWQQAKCCLMWKPSQHPALHCSVWWTGWNKKSWRAWTSHRASSPQQWEGKWFGVLVGAFFFLATEVARTSEATKEDLSSKVTSRIWSWLRWKRHRLQQRKCLERNSPVATGAVWPRQEPCQTLLEPHHYWHHSTALRVGSEHVQNSTTKPPCRRNLTHSQHGIIVLWGTQGRPCHENWR